MPRSAAATPGAGPARLAVSPSAIALVHLASYRTREEAESFAAGLVPPAGRVVYLQSVQAGDTMWHRVLLGDFDDLAAAAAYASAAQQAGTYAYAQAVQLAADGLRAWSPRQE